VSPAGDGADGGSAGAGRGGIGRGTFDRIVDGIACLDLDYSEDSRAEVDFNIVSTEAGKYVELQGTAEGKPFGRADVDLLLDLAATGLERLFAAQAETLAKVAR
jgi:ribonuclease PH